MLKHILATSGNILATCATKTCAALSRFIITTTASRRLGPLTFALCLMAVALAACSKQDDTKEAHLSRANDYFTAGQYDKAEKEYRDVLRLAPADPAARRQLGLLYQEQG